MKKILPKLIGTWLNTLALFSPGLAGKIGFDLFCTPRPHPVKDYHRQFFETAEQGSFECDGNTIHTYRWGIGPVTILFLHGWQSHSFRWIKYIKNFSKEEFSMYALDAPAHGLSGGKYITLPLYSNAVTMFIKQLQSVDAVVTHSFGGFSILYAMYLNPQLPVKRIVLTGVPGEVSEFLSFYRNILGLTNKSFKAILARFTEKTHHSPQFFSAEQFAATITIPGLIIHDKKDPDAPYQHAVKIHEAWKGSRMITTDGLGHNLKSPEVMEWIRQFVSTSKAPVEKQL